MAVAKHTTVPAVGKPSDEQISAFMCKLLDPLSDAEIRDREMEKLERKAKAARRQTLRHDWAVGMMHVEIADADLKKLRATRWLAARNRTFANLLEQIKVEEAERLELHAAIERYHKATARQVLIPAPVAYDFNWKLRTFAFKHRATPEMIAAVEADRVRLNIKAGA